VQWNMLLISCRGKEFDRDNRRSSGLLIDLVQRPERMGDLGPAGR